MLFRRLHLVCFIAHIVYCWTYFCFLSFWSIFNNFHSVQYWHFGFLFANCGALEFHVISVVVLLYLVGHKYYIRINININLQFTTTCVNGISFLVIVPCFYWKNWTKPVKHKNVNIFWCPYHSFNNTRNLSGYLMCEMICDIYTIYSEHTSFTQQNAALEGY